jgi:ankyrin repeat protein
MNVVTWNDYDLAKLLLELGSDKALDKDGSTAKDIAYEMGHRAIYQLLE